MKPLNITILILFASFIGYGQTGKRKTFLTKTNSTNIISNSHDFLRAAKGAENYIKSLLGDTIYENHIKINYKQSNQADFGVYTGTTFKSKFIETHIYYNIHYYLVDNSDTLSYFNLLVDSIGRPTPYDKGFCFSSPTKLILCFKKLFPNKFKIAFATAIEIGRQHGFESTPFLNYEPLNTKGIYWSFSNKLADGKRKLMDINAETGIVKEFYMPVLEH